MMDKLVETKQHMHGMAHITTKKCPLSYGTEHQIQCMHIFCGHINHVSTNEKKMKQINKYRKHDNR